MSDAHYLIGIDLGTTHTVVACAKITGVEGASPRLFPIPQLVAPGEVAEKPMLPSFRYHPAAGELADPELSLPWGRSALPGEIGRVVIGEWARELGSKVEGRLVSSAKSWLSHPQVDRGQPILPWAAAEGVERVSPVLASASYLHYVRQAWNHAHPQHPMEDQELVVTIPASFDEAARALTVEAAVQAGLPSILLLEEPQAVCYDWYSRQREEAVRHLSDSRLLMVCDVGGGTTDLSLIRVEIVDGSLNLTRVGVGDHLMLGGDNIDLALAHLAEQRIVKGESSLSAAGLSQLIQQTRMAKESLLSGNSPERARVTLLGSGSRLVAGARSCELSRREVSELALDGFLPMTGLEEYPAGRRSAMVEFGLPYAADPAISRHIAAFLGRHAAVCRKALHLPEGDPRPAVPDTVLLNGGVFNSPPFKARVLGLLRLWAGRPLVELVNDSPDLAVARGAVAYLMARRGAQMRIGGGSARSFFLQVGGEPQAQRCICLLPRGTEEGVEIRLDEKRFSLRLGEPVQFNLLSSGSGSDHHAGDLLSMDDEQLLPLPPLAVALDSRGAQPDQVEVVLAATITPVGTLLLECVNPANPGQRWRVEFQLRGDMAQTQGAVPRATGLPPGFEAARESLGIVFGRRSKGVDQNAVKRLRRDLEKLLGNQDDWEMPVLRALFDELAGYSASRRRSANHERVWFSLAGLGLRPGFGHPLDEWRVQQVWPLFGQGLQYGREPQAWSTWWIFWRRAAGGLDQLQQQQIFDRIEGDLSSAALRGRRQQTDGKARSFDDMLRLAASLEHLPVPVKVALGRWLVTGLEKSGGTPTGWWALGRIAAREPFHGSAHNVIPGETVHEWLPLLLAQDWKKEQDAAFAAVMMGRVTGDRSRDLGQEDRIRIKDRLEAARAPERWRDMVSAVTVLDEQETRRFFGERLPAGLRLLD